MSQKPISLSADLKRLRDEGYLISIVGGLLVMSEVPYVDSNRNVRRGTLISSLVLAGDVTQRPDTHVVHFDGETPCAADGTPLAKIINESCLKSLQNGMTARHVFSSKPDGNYTDYYHKMSTYSSLLSGPAALIEPGATARVFQVPDAGDDSVFNYTETASDRVGIGALTDKLRNEVVVIVGLGGTGSYLLDLIAKTPVKEIRIIDGDVFLQHNAFRAPGAPTSEELRAAPKKVDYLTGIYSRMHRRIVPVPEALTGKNIGHLSGATFVFLSMDAGEEKRIIVEKLEELGIPFIDMGMGLELVDRTLGGIVRTTTSIPGSRAHLRSRVSFTPNREDDVYRSNIQVADLNALNAVMASIKWKKYRQFYRDLEGELHSTYTTDGNLLLNGDTSCSRLAS